MLNKLGKLIDRYSRVSAEHSTAATMNDEFSKGVCSVVDGVVSDLKSLKKEIPKLFKCNFEVDTGYSYKKFVKYVFANSESECRGILESDANILSNNDAMITDYSVEEVEVKYGSIM